MGSSTMQAGGNVAGAALSPPVTRRSSIQAEGSRNLYEEKGSPSHQEPRNSLPRNESHLRELFDAEHPRVAEFIEAKGLTPWKTEIVERSRARFTKQEVKTQNSGPCERLQSVLCHEAFTAIYINMEARIRRLIRAMNATDWEDKIFFETWEAVWQWLQSKRRVDKSDITGFVVQICRHKVYDAFREAKIARTGGRQCVTAGSTIDHLADANGNVFNPPPTPWESSPGYAGDLEREDMPSTTTDQIPEEGSQPNSRGLARHLWRFIEKKMGPMQRRALLAHLEHELHEGLTGLQAAAHIGMKPSSYRVAKWRAFRALRRETSRLERAHD